MNRSSKRAPLLKVGMLLVGISSVAPWAVTAQESPPMVIYDLAMTLETQAASPSSLAAFSGKPLIISMFYASCDVACPMIINDIKSLERGLAPEDRKDVQVLLVSFDPATDTAALLMKTAVKHKLDVSRWTLARASADDVENLAAVLGVKYKKVNPRTINHTSVITIVAPNGQIVRQTERYRSDAADMIKALKAATSGASDDRAKGA